MKKSVPSNRESALAADKARALAMTPVSRETEQRLDAFVSLLIHWQNRINLIAPSTLPEIWTRHIADSLQLLMLVEDAKLWIDLGSGGGFPALPLACSLAEQPGVQVHLVESNQKKAAFLREAVRALELPATVHAQRIEDFAQHFSGHADIVTARALAPLAKLFPHAYPLLKTGTKALLLKGQDVGSELTEASKYWTIKCEMASSKTNPGSQILVLHGLEPRSGLPASERKAP